MYPLESHACSLVYPVCFTSNMSFARGYLFFLSSILIPDFSYLNMIPCYRFTILVLISAPCTRLFVCLTHQSFASKTGYQQGMKFSSPSSTLE
jgi:hypothetical protein